MTTSILNKTWARIITITTVMLFFSQSISIVTAETGEKCLAPTSIFKLFNIKGKTLRKALDTEARLFALRKIILRGELNSDRLRKKDQQMVNAEFIEEIKFSYEVQKVRGYENVYFMGSNRLYEYQYGNEQVVLFYSKERIPWKLLRENYGVFTSEDEDYAKRGFWIASVGSNLSDGSRNHLTRRDSIIEYLNTLYRYIFHITPRFNVGNRSSTAKLNLETAQKEARQRENSLDEKRLRRLSTNMPFDIYGVLIMNINTSKVILLTGHSGSGKTTLKNALVETGEWKEIADDQLAGYVVEVESGFELYAGENPSTLLWRIKEKRTGIDKISPSFYHIDKIYEIANSEQIKAFTEFARRAGRKPNYDVGASLAKSDLQGQFEIKTVTVKTSSIVQDATELAERIASEYPIDTEGKIIQGTEAKKELDADRAAGKYKPLKETHPALLREVQRVAKKAGVSLEGVTVFGIQSIGKASNDFVHGHFDRQANELFLAVNIMEQAEKYGKTTLEQYIRHELECTGDNHQTLRKQYKQDYAQSGSFDLSNPEDEGRLRDIIREDTDIRVAANQYIETIKSVREKTHDQKVVLALDTDMGGMSNNPELLRQIGDVAGLLGNIDFIADSGETSLEEKISAKVGELREKGVASENIKVIVVTNKKGKFEEHMVTLVDDNAVVNYIPIEILGFALTLHLEPTNIDRLKELYHAITGQDLRETDIDQIRKGELALILPPIEKISPEIYKGAIEVLTAA